MGFGDFGFGPGFSVNGFLCPPLVLLFFLFSFQHHSNTHQHERADHTQTVHELAGDQSTWPALAIEPPGPEDQTNGGTRPASQINKFGIEISKAAQNLISNFDFLDQGLKIKLDTDYRVANLFLLTVNFFVFLIFFYAYTKF